MSVYKIQKKDNFLKLRQAWYHNKAFKDKLQENIIINLFLHLYEITFQ